MKLSIITVNYNGVNDTTELLASLYHYITDIDYEIIVIDNGSTIDESIAIKDSFPKTIVIRSNENLGFAGGNNLGIREAKGEYLFFINNDTYIEDDSVKFIIECMDKNPNIGALSPKIRFSFGNKAIQFAGYTHLSRITLKNRLIGYEEEDKGQYNTLISTPFVQGAAMLVSKKAINKVWEIPDFYFLYYEELDWSERIREGGFDMVYEPRCTIYHKESCSTGRRSAVREYYLNRNRLYYINRNRKGLEMILALVYQLFLVNLFKAIIDLIKGKHEFLRMRFRAVNDYIRKRNGKLYM